VLRGLLERRVDAALVYAGEEPPAELGFRPVATERLLVAVPASHPLAGSEAAPLERFATDTFIGVPVGTTGSWRGRLREVFARHGIDPPMGPEVSSVVSHLWMVQTGQGLTVVPEQAAARPVEGVEFVEALGEHISFGVAWRADRPPVRLADLLAGAERAARALGLAPPAADPWSA
jgi:DNA-binding transcriptional LysR family regulator